MLVSNGQLVRKSVNYEYVAARWTTSGSPDPFAWASYGAIYKQQLWVAVVVNKRAGMVSRLPLKVYRRGRKGRSEARLHPYSKLLRSPNPRIDPFLFWSWTMSTFDIFGEAFWSKIRDPGGRPYALSPLHPTCMTREDDGTWTYRRGAVERRGIPRSDLVHFRTYNPDDQERGLSRLEPLRQTLENEWSARTATSSFWRRGARPGMALTHPGNLSQKAAERLKAQFDSVAGGAGNTGATVVLEEGMQPAVMSLSANEAQYIQSRQLNREEIVAAFDMPPPAVHILDHATFSNITEQFRSVYRDTMAPPLRYFESVLEADLRSQDFGDEVYAEFLMDEVLRGDFEARQTAYRMADYMTIAEKRELENLPFIDGTDRIVINAASIPLDQIDEVTQARTASGQLPRAVPDVTRSVPLDTARAITSRIASKGELSEVESGLFDDLPGADGARELLVAVMSEAGTLSEFKSRLWALVKE